MSLHQAPTDGGDYHGFHFHVEFHPPLRKPNLLKYLAGPEIGGGNFLSDTSPGEKALDKLLRGHRAAVDAGVPFYHGDIGDRQLVKRICQDHGIEACIHFAALAYVGESVSEPKRYYENNVEQGIALLDSLLASGVRLFVFSSSCATYGEPVRIPIDELHRQQPTNPYGWSKLLMEVIETARRVTNREIRAKIEPACPGDPSRLVANADKVGSILGWRPQYPELESIIRTAWEWHQANPHGYHQ